MRGLMPAATRIAIALSHPAYDCVYLALALAKQTRYVTADDRLIRKLALQRDTRSFSGSHVACRCVGGKVTDWMGKGRSGAAIASRRWQ